MELFGYGVFTIVTVIGISVIVLLWLADRRQSGRNERSGLTRSSGTVSSISGDGDADGGGGFAGGFSDGDGGTGGGAGGGSGGGDRA